MINDNRREQLAMQADTLFSFSAASDVSAKGGFLRTTEFVLI